MYDVVVVGLGVMGLSTLYHCSKVPGLKVLGIEKNAEVGMLGTSSYGHTRIWRVSHGDLKYTKMMKEALPLWKEIERESGVKLLVRTGGLDYGPKESKGMQTIFNTFEGDRLDAQGIMERFPAMKVPDNYIGLFTELMGIIKAKETLKVLESLARKNGAEILFEKEVTKIEGDTLYLDDGTTIKTKKTAITCGKETPDLVPEQNVEHHEVEYMTITDPTGLPPVFLEYQGKDDCVFYGLREGENLEHIKAGLHYTRNAKELLHLIKKRMPSKLKHCKHTTPCFYSVYADGEFQLSYKDNIAHCYAFSGTGFKHSPLLGKKVMQLLTTKTIAKL